MLTITTEFFGYFWTVLRRVWWQTALIGILFIFPCDLLDGVVTAYVMDDSNQSLSDLTSTGIYAIYNTLIGSLGVALLLALVQEVTRAEPSQSDYHTSTPASYWFALAPSIFRRGYRMWVPMMGLTAIAVLVYEISNLLFCIPLLYFAVKFSTTAPVIAEEGATAIKALKRGWRQTNGHFWEVFAFCTLVGMLLIGVFAPFIALVIALTLFAPQLNQPQLWPVSVLLAVPLNVSTSYLFVFSYCIYNYLVRLETEPDKLLAIESLQQALQPRHPDLPSTT